MEGPLGGGPSPPLDLLEMPHGTKVGCLPSLGSRLTSQGSSSGPDASAGQPSMGVLVNQQGQYS